MVSGLVNSKIKSSVLPNFLLHVCMSDSLLSTQRTDCNSWIRQPPTPCSNTNSKHPLKCNGDVSKNSLVNHPLWWRLWRLHVGTGICKIFTIVLQKLVSYLNIFQNKQSNSKHCKMSSDLQEILLLLTFRLA